MKIIIFVIVFLALWCFYLNYRVDILKKENDALQVEKNALNETVKGYEETIKGYENAKVESDKTIKKLRDAAEQDKKNLDWYNERVPYDVLDVVQKQYNNR